MKNQIYIAISSLFITMGIIFGCTTMQQATPTIPVDVAKSSCAAYSWKNRGKPPIGYLKGMAAIYAHDVCLLKAGSKGPVDVMSQPVGNDSNDALAHFGINGATPAERLRKTYTLLIGLGMRESSGQYGTGPDSTVPHPTPYSAETGLWQFSYDSIGASPELKAVYNNYAARPSDCLLSTFAEGAHGIREGYVGTGPGYDFQKFMRSCPAAQAEYSAVGIRVLRKHWGPLNRKEAEFIPACESMLADVEKATVCP